MVKEIGKRILCCAVDGGAYGALVPVATELQTHGHLVSWVTHQDGVASKKLDESAYRIEDTDANISAILGLLKPDVVLAGVSGNDSDLAHYLPAFAMKMGIKVVKVVDFYGTGHPHETGFAPTKLCVLDEASRAFESQARGMDIKNIIATGSPTFDALLEVKALPKGTFEHPLVLLVMPSNLERVREFLDVIVPSLRKLARPITLGVSVHPKSLPPKGDVIQEELYLELQDCSPFIHLMKDDMLRAKGNNVELIASAMLVFGTTSTELVQACYLRRPTFSVLPSGGPNEVLLTSRGLSSMPTSEFKATLRTSNAETLENYLRGFLLEGDSEKWELFEMMMHRAQANNYILDGRNTVRVVEVVESLF